MESYKENEPFDTYLSTTVGSDEYSLKWTFENFSKYISVSNQSSSVISHNFYPHRNESNTYWHINIKNEGPWCVYLHRSRCTTKVHLEWKLSVFDEENKVLYEIRIPEIIEVNKRTICYTISESDLEKINESKTSDTVILVIYLKIFKLETTTFSEQPSYACVLRDAQQSFSENMVKIYDDQLGTDITLKIGDETVGAHKIILSARSPVFAKMFQQEMAESQSHVVDIPDIKMSTLKMLLSFFYSGQRGYYSFVTVLDVYYAADKYQVLQLKEMCSTILISNLSCNNVIKLLHFADRHSDWTLKDKALKFLRLNFMKCVESEDWIQLQNEKSELYTEAINYIKK